MKGPQLLVVMAICILLLLGSIVLLLLNANGSAITDAFAGPAFDACGVAPGSVGGWLVLLIGGGLAVFVIAGTVSLVRYAIGLFRE